MRITMIHAIAESIPPVRLAFSEEFPGAEVINVLDEGLLTDFDGQLTPSLRRRMTNLIGYCQDNNADAIGLACSVYAPVVDSAKGLIDIPLVSSYGSVMADAVGISVSSVLRIWDTYGLIVSARRWAINCSPFSDTWKKSM